MVVLVVGGGMRALRAAYKACTQQRPVIVFPECGGVAREIYDLCLGGDWSAHGASAHAELGMGRDRSLAGAAASPEGDSADAVTVAAVCKLQRWMRQLIIRRKTSLLAAIRRMLASDGDVQVSAYLCDSAAAPLDKTILQALLDDCEGTAQSEDDALTLAVSWRNPELVRRRLQASKSADWEDGLALPMEAALVASDADVLQVCLDFGAKPGMFHLERLVLPGSRAAAVDKHGALPTSGITPAGSVESSLQRAMVQSRGSLILSESDHGAADAVGSLERAWEAAVARLTQCSAFGDHASWRQVCREVGEWQSSSQHHFLVAPASLLGFVVLSDANNRVSLDWQFGYQSDHLRFRGYQAAAMGEVLCPTWLDLFFWAVLMRQPSVARVLWTKVDEPLRAALMASILCQLQANETSGHAAEQVNPPHSPHRAPSPSSPLPSPSPPPLPFPSPWVRAADALPSPRPHQLSPVSSHPLPSACCLVCVLHSSSR